MGGTGRFRGGGFIYLFIYLYDGRGGEELLGWGGGGIESRCRAMDNIVSSLFVVHKSGFDNLLSACKTVEITYYPGFPFKYYKLLQKLNRLFFTTS